MFIKLTVGSTERTGDTLIFVQLLIIFWRFAQIDKHEEAIAGVDNRVDKVAEDGDEMVDLLYLLPLQIEERLQELFIAISVHIFSQHHSDNC